MRYLDALQAIQEFINISPGSPECSRAIDALAYLGSAGLPAAEPDPEETLIEPLKPSKKGKPP